MRSDDVTLAQSVRDALPADPDVPGFDAVWAAAEQRHRGRRRRYAGTAAAAVAAIALLVVLRPGTEPPMPEVWIGDELLKSTSWSAPSDVLLPQREFDIYQELPSLNTSTNWAEGSLL